MAVWAKKGTKEAVIRENFVILHPVMRKTIFCFFATVAAACGPQTAQEPQQEPQDAGDTAAVRIAVTPTLDCMPLFVAADRHLFERAGLSIGITPFQAQMDQDTAVMAGSVAGAMTDLVRAERLKSQGVGLRYATATEASWQLLTSRTARVKQPHQLNDKMVAMTRFSATHLLCDLMVDSSRLPSEHVFRIQVNDVAVRLNMLQVGNMDALLLPEPQATAARNMKAYVLYDSRKADVRLGVLALREGALDSAQWKTLQQVYDEACDSLNERGLAAYADVIRERTGVARRTIDSLPADYRFAHWAQPREADIERARKWLKK